MKYDRKVIFSVCLFVHQEEEVPHSLVRGPFLSSGNRFFLRGRGYQVSGLRSGYPLTRARLGWGYPSRVLGHGTPPQSGPGQGVGRRRGYPSQVLGEGTRSPWPRPGQGEWRMSGEGYPSQVIGQSTPIRHPGQHMPWTG